MFYSSLLFLFLAGCSSNFVIKNYAPQNAFKTYLYEYSDNTSLEEIFESSLDELVVSDVFDSTFISSMKDISKYNLSFGNKTYNGYYDSNNIVINVIMQSYSDFKKESLKKIKDFDSDSQKIYLENMFYDYLIDLKHQIPRVIVHELAHHYFNNYLTETDQNDFRNLILQYKNNFTELTKYYEDFNLIPDEKLNEFGFTKDFFKMFSNFLSLRNTECYKDNSDYIFYGTEAYAQLSENDISNKLFLINLLNNIDSKKNMSDITGQLPITSDSDDFLSDSDEFKLLCSAFDDLEKSITLDELNKDLEISKDLIKFYQGFLNQKYLH